MTETLTELGRHIAAKLGPAIMGSKLAFGELTMEANAADIVAVLDHVGWEGEDQRLQGGTTVVSRPEWRS